MATASELLAPNQLPFFKAGVRAGFPSPANDYLEGNICLQDLSVENPAATFLVRVEGHSMKDSGILDGDIAVVDRSIYPATGKIVVAVVDGEFCIKRLIYREGKCFLQSANATFPEIEFSEHSENSVWGVVAHVIHKLK